MKRIRVWADTHSTGLFDDKGEFFLQEETTIKDNTWENLQKWVEQYDDVLIMTSNERIKNMTFIDELDNIGKILLSQIEREWTHDIQTGEKLFFEYCSEGRYEYQ